MHKLAFSSDGTYLATASDDRTVKIWELRNLKAANLLRAVLSGTDLSGTNLSQADLSGVDLSGAILREAEYNSEPYLDEFGYEYEPTIWPDHFDPAVVHLAQRDVTLLAVSRAPYPQIAAFKERMGWRFKWVSSFGTAFNEDYHVSFSEDAPQAGEVYYNYAMTPFPSTEAPGLSVFRKDDGEIFHSYSCYARGLDMLITAYNYLDLVPKGRDEDDLPYSMDWVRHHDRYEA